MSLREKFQYISLALVKVSVGVRRAVFRERIERVAFQMLEDFSMKEFENAIKTASLAKDFVTLGRAIYEIEPINANFLIEELEILISKLKEVSGSGNINLSKGAENQEIRKSEINYLSGNGDLKKAISYERDRVPKVNEEIISRNESGNEDADQEIRQSEILSVIRKIGKRPIQSKEIASEFPKVSERTIRNDLQKLCNQRILSRIGSGPATYYEYLGRLPVNEGDFLVTKE